MDKVKNHELVACCTPIEMQHATFSQFTATNNATNNATNSLKALAGAVLERNTRRNQCATSLEKPCNFEHEIERQKLHEIELKNPAFSEPENSKIAEGKEQKQIIVVCYTPNGKPIEVEARDQEHAAWLLKMNPKPTRTGAVENLKKPGIQQAIKTHPNG